MKPLSTYYRVPVYEGHAGNRLRVSGEQLKRLRDLGFLELRRYRLRLRRDRLMRRYVGEELRDLEVVAVEGLRELRERVHDVERSLAGGEVPVDGDGDPRDEAASPRPPGGDSPRDGADRSEEPAAAFGVAANDPEITFTRDFRGELIETMFGSAQMWTFSFGAWYYRVKRLLFAQPQWKRVYRIAQVEQLSLSKELLLGVVNAVEKITVYPTYDCVMSDVEAAACLLAAYESTLDDGRPEPQTVEEVLGRLPHLLRRLADDIAAEVARSPPERAGGYFPYRDRADLKFYVPVHAGRHYAAGTFDEHALVDLLFRRGVLVRLPGRHSPLTEMNERLSGQAAGDRLFVWTRRLLRRRLPGDVPLLVHEQQYLRSGLTAIEAFLVLWKVVNAESVFASRKGTFRLADVLTDLALEEPPLPPPEEAGYVGDRVKNFEYLLEHYVVRWYGRDETVTVSQLFPGLALLLVAESVRSGWDPQRRQDVTAAAAAAHEAKNLVAVRPGRSDPVVEYMLTQSATRQSDLERLEAHDRLLFHYEHGLDRLLSVALPRHRVLALASSLFNVSDVYECLYFLVLGFLPTIAVT
ncbi:T77 [Tupaiid betaherpesvirus 1]|uniref:T77 n=1 Tax=Tupaiid herpesvirus 1 (strain 1) TaxID=10397 RepID=Q91TL9_TUHV1|nr:T77 [Tupaiid betaherpesvirus 1]AAK57122.1 T77 [Tupaiid betaherpesvirus 1]